MGVETSDKRSADTVNMLDYGFNTYKLDIILSKDKSLGKVRIENGKKEEADLVLIDNATKLKKVTDEDKNYTLNIKPNRKLKAPIKKGDIVGSVEIIDNEGNIIAEENMTIKQDIKKATLWDLFKRNLKEITGGKNLIRN